MAGRDRRRSYPRPMRPFTRDRSAHTSPPPTTPPAAGNARIRLDVAFADNARVKALGARWDPDQRCWWIAREHWRDELSAWLPRPPVPAIVLAITISCWRCHTPTAAILGVLVAAHLHPDRDPWGFIPFSDVADALTIAARRLARRPPHRHDQSPPQPRTAAPLHLQRLRLLRRAARRLLPARGARRARQQRPHARRARRRRHAATRRGDPRRRGIRQPGIRPPAPRRARAALQPATAKLSAARRTPRRRHRRRNRQRLRAVHDDGRLGDIAGIVLFPRPASQHEPERAYANTGGRYVDEYTSGVTPRAQQPRAIAESSLRCP